MTLWSRPQHIKHIKNNNINEMTEQKRITEGTTTNQEQQIRNEIASQ